MDILSQEGVDFSINSNLHLLTKRDAKTLKEKGTKNVLTSILGQKEIHEKINGVPNSFHRVMDSIELLLKENIPVVANMVVLESNVEQVYKTGKMIWEKFKIPFAATPKVPACGNPNLKMLDRKQYIGVLDDLIKLSSDFKMNIQSLHPPLPCMFNDSERLKYQYFLDSRKCGAGRGTVAFSINGDVRACSHEKEVYGNLLKESFKDIFERMSSWRKGNFIPEECNPCSYYYQCRGGVEVLQKLLILQKMQFILILEDL